MPAKKTFLGSLARLILTPMSRARLPQTDGTLTLQGLTAPVEIIRDRWGIPHIYAENRADLFFAQGFAHAQDRLFQMELNRRTAQGTLSELFGEIAFDTDRAIRTFGFARLGRVDFERGAPDVKDALTAYAAGVNAFMAHPKSKLPVEFTLLGHKPAPWQPEESAQFARVMIWQLSHAWQGEILRAEIVEKVGPEHAAELEIHFPAGNPLTLPQGIEFNALDPDGLLRKIPSPFLDRGKGSNAWAVSPRRSATGGAVLSNDMHLAVSMPSLWYETHLHAPDFHVTGVSLPGVPMILVGHNERIAWGMTLAFIDAEDLYIEQLDAENRYLYKDEWHAAEIIEEPIRVKGRKETHIERVIVTRHGPIISDVVGYPAQKVAVQSMALQPVPALEGWLRLNTARGWDDFVEAMRCIEAPQLNVAYADVENNIGYWASGRVPVRAKGDGSTPAPGWTGEFEWVGEVPFEAMPHALNPEQGYLVTCNHKVVPDDYPHFLGNVWMNGYRARRLSDLIEGQDQLSLQDHARFHRDFTCLPGIELQARLKDFPVPEGGDATLTLELLSAWDGILAPESVGGAVYEVVRYTLVRNLFVPGLGAELSTRVMGEGFHPLLMHSNEFFGHDTVVLLRMLANPDSWWVQQAGGYENWVGRSLAEAIAWLRETLGPDESDWAWGNFHKVNFEHPLGAQKPLDQAFNRGPYAIGGDADTPCQTAMAPGAPYNNRAWSPTFRQIVDMKDLSQSLSMHPPGQSGQLASPHYDDLAELWLNVEYHPMLWTRAQVDEASQHTLVLKP